MRTMRGRLLRAPRGAASAGFTLAEVAVTLLIVGSALLALLQGISDAKLRAAQTRNERLAHELALFTLGQIESGIYRESLQERFSDSYAEESYPDFHFEVILGREGTFPDGEEYQWGNPFLADLGYYDDQEDEDEETEEPYEVVRIRVSFPQILEFSNSIELERWVPWEQVHLTEDEEEGDQGAGP